MPLELFDGRPHIGVKSRVRWDGSRAGTSSCQALNLTHGEAAAGGALGETEAHFSVSNSQQSPSMAGGNPSVLDKVLYALFQFQQPDSIGDRSAILAGPLGDVLLGEMEIGHQTLECARLLHGVEVFALDVLDQRELQGRFFGDVADDGGNARQGSPLCSAPAALPGDELEPLAYGPENQRLDDSAHADRARQFLQPLIPEARAGLIRTWVNQVNVNLLRLTRMRGCDGGCRAIPQRRLGLPDQGAQTLP